MKLICKIICYLLSSRQTKNKPFDWCEKNNKSFERTLRVTNEPQCFKPEPIVTSQPQYRYVSVDLWYSFYIFKLFQLQILSICFNSIETPGYKVRKHHLSEEFKFKPVRLTKMVTTTKSFTSISFSNQQHNIALVTFVVFICINVYHTGFNNGLFILSCLLCLNQSCLISVAQKINRNHPQHLLGPQIQSDPNPHHTYPLPCQLWEILTI